VVTGSVKTKDRERIRKEVELVDNAIILATYGVFAAGVSINRLHHLIFASPRKSKINILQTIGRLLRKHDSKEVSYIYDIVDDFSYKTKKGSLKRNYLLDHGIQRSKFYVQQKFKFTVKKIPFDPR
jgi:superfamily II DNA or RNA helicase